MGLGKIFQGRIRGQRRDDHRRAKIQRGATRILNAQLTAIKAGEPGRQSSCPAIIPRLGLIALQAKQLGITVPLFGGDGWESASLIQIGGAALGG